MLSDDNLNFSRAAGTCDKEAGLGGDERIQQLQGELIGSEIGRIEADERVRGRDSEVRRCVEIELIGTIAPLGQSAGHGDWRRSFGLGHREMDCSAVPVQ